MLVITWNVHSIKGLKADRLGRILGMIKDAGPDILLLQEVGLGEPARMLSEGLSRGGLGSQFYSGIESEPRKPYGNLIASKWPVTGDQTKWAPKAPWPQLLARATVEIPADPVEVYAAHIPNGSGNGWAKIDTFEALAAALGRPKVPTILGGDFNEPKYVRKTGEVVPFGGVETPDGVMRWSGDRYHAKSESTFPRHRWRDGVLSVLGTDAPHGLRHSYLELHGFKAETTHITRRNARFFDHLLVSQHFKILASGYYKEWMKAGLSDHAAAWARLRLR